MEDKDLPGALIGYRKDGRPIHLIAGGDPSNDPPDGGAGDPPKTFTEEELNRLLQRERDKLHGRLSKADERQAQMDAELKELRKTESERAAAEKKARDEAEAAARKAAEAEMSAKELIDRRTAELAAQYEAQQNEWASRYSTLETKFTEQQAIFAKEREFQELASYAQAKVNENQDNIAPELVDYITGTTKEEIDASVALAVEKTNRIVAGLAAAQQAARAGMPGVSTGGFTPTGPMDAQGGQQTFTAEQIKAMSGPEYAKHRAAFGVTGNNVSANQNPRLPNLGVGIFG